MKKKKREFVDDDHYGVSEKYFELMEQYDGKNASQIIPGLRKLIKQDPVYFDTYLFLSDLLENQNKIAESVKIQEEAYNKAIKLISDKDGNWPDLLEWGFVENRHIIRAILNKAMLCWLLEENDNALEIFTKLLKTNPNDNAGTRYFILAIREGMTYDSFHKRFDRGGYFDKELDKWFEKEFKKYPEEFDWWVKEMKKIGVSF